MDARSSGTAAGDPGPPGARDDNSDEVRGYFVGECGHPALLVGPVVRVGPCMECDADAT